MPTNYEAHHIPVAEVYCDLNSNCRDPFTLESLTDFAAGIEKNGLRTPVTVRPLTCLGTVPYGITEAHKYHLVAGHRRFITTSQILKWETIPAYIRELSDDDAWLENFEENIERENLNGMEVARSLDRRYAGLSIRQIAATVRKSERWVASRMHLLKLPEEVQQMVAAGRLTLADAEVIGQQPTASRQLKLAREMVAAGREGKRKVAERVKITAKTQKTKGEINGLIEQMFNRQANWLGPRVAAWCMGNLTDDEIMVDIEKSAAENFPKN